MILVLEYDDRTMHFYEGSEEDVSSMAKDLNNLLVEELPHYQGDGGLFISLNRLRRIFFVTSQQETGIPINIGSGEQDEGKAPLKELDAEIEKAASDTKKSFEDFSWKGQDE